jgi:uncharacterized protein DUF4242
VPRAAAVDLAQTASRADVEARRIACIRFLRAILVPEDETCFLLYEAASPELVAEASRRVSLSCDRIVEVFEASTIPR